jgi:hypothetical protein
MGGPDSRAIPSPSAVHPLAGLWSGVPRPPVNGARSIGRARPCGAPDLRCMSFSGSVAL